MEKLKQWWHSHKERKRLHKEVVNELHKANKAWSWAEKARHIEISSDDLEEELTGRHEIYRPDPPSKG